MTAFSLFTVLLALLVTPALGRDTHDISPDGMPKEQPRMTVTEMIQYWGYPVEEHTVTTEDGYVLLMHRIPEGRSGSGTGGERIPVFLGHCLVGTSAVFSFGPPNNALAYMLADAGYDVWMGNTRGSTWSKSHESLDPCSSCPEFWDFSWDTTGTLDYSAEVDYILQSTGFEKLFVAGYSMGTTQYFAWLSERPEYNDKVRAGFIMAPPVFMGDASSRLFDLAEEAEELQDRFHEAGRYEFLPHWDFLHLIAHEICDDEHPVTEHVCGNVISAVGGVNPELLNETMISFYLDHFPGGTSTQTFVHYAQLHLKPGVFERYDYMNAEENLAHYGQETPPSFDLTKVTAPTAIFAGDADGLVALTDVARLLDVLPNVLNYEIVPYSPWTHTDFFAANNVGDLVYSKIIQLMREN